MTGPILDASLLTAELAGLTTVLLMALVIPLAWGLTLLRGAWADLVGAVAMVPLVLPPSVLGFYLLLALAPGGVVAGLVGPLAFTFPGLVLGPMLYSLPFALQPVRDAFEAKGRPALAEAMSLGAGPIDGFVTASAAAGQSGPGTGSLLAFAHTVGEFGVVLMIGGNIQRQTRVLSIAIWDEVEAGHWREAHLMSAGLVVLALAVLVALRRLSRRDPP